MSADILSLIPELQPFAQALVDLGGRAGVQPRVTSTLRSNSQQQRLYASYLRGESHYPVAPPGTSAHEFGYAFDMVADSTEDLLDLGTVWTQWGGIWSPTDEVHFEYPGFTVPATAPEYLPSSTQVGQYLQSFLIDLKSLPWPIQLAIPTWLSTEASAGRLRTDSPGGRWLCRNFNVC